MGKKATHVSVSNYYVPSAKPAVSFKGASKKFAFRKANKLDPKQRAKEKKASKKKRVSKR